MKSINHPVLGTASVLFMLSAGAASAQEFPRADAVVLEDVIAAVRILPSADGAITVDGATGADRALTVSGDDGTVTIAGPDEIDEEAFWHDYMDGAGGLRIGPFRFKTNGYRSIEIKNGRDARFEALLEEYPAVTIRVPEGTALRFDSSALLLETDVTLGRVEADGNVYVRATMGDVDSTKLDLTGVGLIAVGDVAGLADAALSGSGDIKLGRAASAILVLSGSGDIEAEDVSGDAVIELRGSGDVSAGDIGGAAKLVLRGSGDVEVGTIGAGLDAELAGSGDIETVSVAGPVNASLRGSGDIEIDRGRAEAFEATLSGSGSIAFGGTAVNPVLRTSGSGDIDIDAAEGTVDARGRGITVAGKSYDED